ncbi:DUF6508 domain-containing protein [Vibrio sp. SCSIO 43136]|uniref:DUF6508 domain-containing protein n=1 Tax=Vibrio sp. SCSIO 43136 TaxID=2819101 RepID=UPI002075BB49|nr:DUF6508 domain-containing protein [Vibrio sp. SCSIO 43136]USD68004.1 hypothetical protein J4N39_17655 [Vibrio sp. SCSIO 43136]
MSIKQADLDFLKQQFIAAKNSLSDIAPYDFVPSYPREIIDFMENLQSDLWVNSNYCFSDSTEVIENLDNASAMDIKGIFTHFARIERFCDGAWIGILEKQPWEQLFERLEQLAR